MKYTVGGGGGGGGNKTAWERGYMHRCAKSNIIDGWVGRVGMPASSDSQGQVSSNKK